jgi:hypothetical protein
MAATNDADLLAQIPEFITLGMPFLKAMPAEEAGERILFMEASNADRTIKTKSCRINHWMTAPAISCGMAMWT